MRATNRMKIGAILTLAGALIFSGAPAFAGGWGGGGSGAGGSYTCTGGEIPSGTYKNVTVSGPCTVGNGAVLTITGNVTVGKGAMLDAQSAPATITIAKNVTALPGAFLGLGCQPPALTGNSAHPCTVNPDGHSNISVNGNVTTAGTTTVLLNGITIARNVTLIGGGGDIPWSIKNNKIGGNVTVAGVSATWFGVLFNTIGKNVTLTHIELADHDPGAPGVYIVRNQIGQHLICSKLTVLGVPGVTGYGNTIGGKALGQCSEIG